MSALVINAFAISNPTIKLTVLTRGFFTPFFKSIPNVTVVAPDLKGRHKGFLGIRTLSKELIDLNIDAVADLHNVLRSNILIQLLRLKRMPFKQIDKGRADKKALVRAKNKVFKPLKSTHERYADVFKALGFHLILDANACLHKLELPEKFISLIGNTTKKSVGIAPFAAHKGKVYPLEKMKQVIEVLSVDYQVLLFGGGTQEKELLDAIAKTHVNVSNLTGKFSFQDELAIISNLDLMVSMDSGNGHLAAMYGVPVLTLWGVTHPYAGFTPFNQSKENQVLPDLKVYPLIPTSIYGNTYPDGYLDCFDTISNETIISKIKTALSNN